jgi:hypothetical protein
MADYSIPSLTTAVFGFDDAVAFQVQTQNTNDITGSNGTVSIGNIDLSSQTIPGFLTGRRPVSGQVFPRGVYNK